MREFLRYVLSREGQAAVQRDGKWLPLTAAVIAEQRKKLDTIAEPVNLPSVSNPFGAGNQ